MIDHITMQVTKLEASKTFYEQALNPLNYKLAFGKKGKFWAFDLTDGYLFEIAQSMDTDALTSCHVAFRVKDRLQVHQFYDAALAAGASCNGGPGLRPQYTDNYYAAFILDPDGHNIEAVCYE